LNKFKRQVNHVVFADIDECLNGENNCDKDVGICTNLAGTYTCSCDQGYIAVVSMSQFS